MVEDKDLISEMLADEGMKGSIAPITTSADVISAAKRLIQGGTPEHERAAILARLEVSGTLASASVPIMLDGFRRLSAASQAGILRVVEGISSQGGDLSESADAIGALLNVPNGGVRDKAVSILEQMGRRAVGAAMHATGCTRHADRAVRLAGLRVLASIGPACPPAVVRRIRGLVDPKSNLDAELQAAAEKVLAEVGKGQSAVRSASGRFRAPASASETCVIKLVHAVAQAPNTGGRHTEVRHKVRQLKPAERQRSLLSCLSSKNPETRSLAAQLMSEDYEDYLSSARVIHAVFRKERDLRVRGHIADLLTLMLCHTTLPDAS